MLDKLFSFSIGLISTFVLWLVIRFPILWIFVPTCLVWLIFLISAFFYRRAAGERKLIGFPIMIVSAVGLLALVVLLEWRWAGYMLAILGGLIMFFLFECARGKEDGLAHELKPTRRVAVALWVFDLYALLCLALALNVFFPNAPFWLINLAASFVAGWVATVIWRMYFAARGGSVIVWSLVLALIVWEIMWVMHLLPLGYFILSALVVWVWYVLQMLVRFHIGAQGIIWKKQIWFLALNAVLFFLILFFFVRWI